MYGYIYLTTNILDGMKYIGLHQQDTFDEHYFGSGVRLKEEVKRQKECLIYKRENFVTIILDTADSQKELNEKEKYYISLYNAVEDDTYYNIARGGGGHTCDPWNKGKKGFQEVTEAMLEALKIGWYLPASEKQRETVRQLRTGCVVSNETRELLRVAKLGTKDSEETRRKKSQAHCGKNNINYGRDFSKSHRDKIRQTQEGRTHIHKGTTNKNVTKEELETYLADGWELGYYYKNKKITETFND